MIEQTISLLGQRATDKVTGFHGAITSVCFDLFGCVQVILTPPVDDKNTKGEVHWFDVNRLDLVGKRVMDVPDFAGRAQVPLEYAFGAAEKPIP